jgi:hypothetical protein
VAIRSRDFVAQDPAPARPVTPGVTGGAAQRIGLWLLVGVPVLSGLFTLVTVVILARVGGRLLGIRMRWRRAILAGFFGLVLGWVAAWSINGQRRGPQALSWPAVLFGSLIATMLLPAGHPHRRPPRAEFVPGRAARSASRPC